MADIDEAFGALQRLDDDGRKALAICTLQLREQLVVAVARAEKTGWLLGRVLKWSSDFGLAFDLAPACAAWDAAHPQEPAIVTPWLVARVAGQRDQIDQLRVRLARVTVSERAAIRRADAAEAERDALLAAHGDPETP
jgi:hypothetical protein